MADKRISQLVERTDIANNDVVPIVASGATTTNKATISSIQEFMQENLDLGVTSVGITLGSTGTDVSVSGSPITTSGNITINIPDASATARGLVTTGTQTFAGAKTFSSDLNINEVNVGRGGGNLTNNTRVGLTALNANTTGQQNTALGTQSLLLSTTGSFNTGLGYNALLTNTVGAANTAVGSQALVLNTTGTSNTAIGNGAGRNNTTGDNNSFLGSLSGADNTTGSSNVAVGLTALSRNITGGQNTAIGRDAGRWIADGVTNNTNTNSSIYIGFFSKANADNQSNQIVIGHNATGQGSNTVTIGNSDITSNKLFGRVIHADAVNADESATLGQVNTSLDGYVTLNTAQTINGFKTFSNTIFATNGITASNPITISSSGNSDSLEVNHSSGSGIALDISKGGNGEGLRVAKTSGSGNAVTITGGLLSAEAATLTGALNGTSASFTGDLTIDTNTLFVDSANNSVGIGTLIPKFQGFNRELTVSGGISGTSRGAINIQGSRTTNSTFGSFAFFHQTNYVAGIESSRAGADNSGNLQFFTTNEGVTGERLTLASTGAATFSSSVTAGGNIQTSGNANTYVKATGFISNQLGQLSDFGASDAGYYIVAGGGIQFVSGGANRMIVNSSGNVGISTASPAERLEVSGNISITASTGSKIGFNTTDSFSQYGTSVAHYGISYGWNTNPLALSGYYGIGLFTDGTEKMRITGDGYARLSAGSNGIQFNGDTAAANALDDYEEGTFTPNAIGTTTAGTVTYGLRNGRYTKIGNSVNFQIAIGWSAHTGTGQLRITGLPFTSINVANTFWSCSVSYSGLALPALSTNKQLTTEIPSNSTGIDMVASDASGLDALAVAVDASVTYIILTGTYFTS
jgi:hypothetical protein